MFPESWQFHVAPYIKGFVYWLLESFSPFFDSVSAVILRVLLNIQSFFATIPWWLIIVIIAIASWFISRDWKTVLFLPLLPLVVGILGLWSFAIETLALVITAVVIALVIGIPVGVLMAEVDLVRELLKPILDGMQTMPSFVYLIPAIMLFGLGKVPAIIATLIYSTPPVVRLTNLGLRQVPEEIQEAAKAFGSTRWQLLKEVRVPLAIPSILMGINQTTMMALAMSVIAAMIGAGGLGQEVLWSINRIKIGKGFEAGIGIVILAIIIDRLTQGIAKRWEPPQS